MHLAVRESDSWRTERRRKGVIDQYAPNPTSLNGIKVQSFIGNPGTQ